MEKKEEKREKNGKKKNVLKMCGKTVKNFRISCDDLKEYLASGMSKKRKIQSSKNKERKKVLTRQIKPRQDKRRRRQGGEDIVCLILLLEMHE